MSAADNLRRARAKIDTPAKWCVNAMALRLQDDLRHLDDDTRAAVLDFSSFWEDCLPEDGEACRFCILGALAVCDLGWYHHRETQIDAVPAVEWNLLRRALPPGFESVEELNDGSEHADVLALFDRAIALAEAP